MLSNFKQSCNLSTSSVVSKGARSLPAVVASMAVLSLVACGGSATQPDVIVQVPAAAAAQAGTSPEQAPATDMVTTPVEVPVQELPVAELPVEEVPVQPAEQDVPYQPNQVVLGAASSLGCETAADAFSETMLELINASRSEARMCGSKGARNAVPVLSWSESLSKAALSHANDMASNNFFSHDGSDGLSVANRADAAGYVWQAVGENIAAGQLNLEEVHQGWIDSPGHCSNIMSNSFTEVGSVCVLDPSSDYETYWVVVFGNAK